MSHCFIYTDLIPCCRDTRGKRLSPANASPLGQKQTAESSRGTSPEPKDKDRARERVQTQDPSNQSGEPEDQKHKESQQEKREKVAKYDQCPTEEKSATEDNLSPKQPRVEAERRSSDGLHWEPEAKRSRLDTEPQTKSTQVKVKEEKREDQESPEVKPPAKTLEKPPQGRRTPGMQPSSLSLIPVPVGVTGVPNSLDRTRLLAPFMGMSPFPGAERLPYSPQHWDPMRNMYRGVDFPQKDPIPKELLMRADPLHRAMAGQHVYPRDPLFHSLALEQQRNQLEERQRLALLREESERGRLLALHHAALEPHLAHPGLLPTAYPSPLFPRLGLHPGPHYSTLHKTLPPGFIHAPPPSLLPAIPSRPTSPRRTTPLPDRQDRSISHPHRDTEAQ